MKVSIRKALAANTPASVMSDYSSDHISALMVQRGIKSIEVSKYVSGFSSAISTAIEFFDDVPKSVRTLGYATKDALGQLMVSSNLIGISVSMEDGELATTRRSWSAAEEACKEPPSEKQEDARKDAQVKPEGETQQQLNQPAQSEQ